jgi:hypothetical protein
MTTAIDTPSELEVEYDRVAYQGTGVQIYQCGPDGNWLFQAPRASLYDDEGNLVAEHLAGPTWQAADGSTVVGRVISKVTPDATAIPWLLLEAVSRGLFRRSCRNAEQLLLRWSSGKWRSAAGSRCA